VVQLDPFKPTSKAPGTKRLKLKHVEMISKFAFKSNLRRYDEECHELTKNKMQHPTETQCGQGLTLVHFSAQRERFLTQNAP
jgi:hypothetical protein